MENAVDVCQVVTLVHPGYVFPMVTLVHASDVCLMVTLVRAADICPMLVHARQFGQLLLLFAARKKLRQSLSTLLSDWN
jgi:hypothetical protein